MKKLTNFLEFIANLEFKPRSRIFLKPKFSSMPCCPNTSPSRAHWQILVFPALTRFNKRTTAWGYMTTRPFKKESMNGQPKALRPIIGKEKRKAHMGSYSLTRNRESLIT